MNIILKSFSLAALGLLVLAPGMTLRADSTRLWINDSDQTWTITRCNRGTYVHNDNRSLRVVNEEIGNMWFSRNGKGLGKIGEGDNTLDAIEFPPHSALSVEFTHTNGAFRHCFKLSAGDDSYIVVNADHFLLTTNLKRHNVELQSDRYHLGTCSSLSRAPIRADRPMADAELNKYICGVILNDNKFGNLTIKDHVDRKAD